jgi:hypothetical protein
MNMREWCGNDECGMGMAYKMFNKGTSTATRLEVDDAGSMRYLRTMEKQKMTIFIEAYIIPLSFKKKCANM